MKLEMTRITYLSSARRANSGDVVVECEMTESQMYAAVLEFLTRISGEKWDQWVSQIERIKP